MQWQFNDGGRSAAGFKGRVGDCVCRAIAIATEQPYISVYDALNNLSLSLRTRSKRTRGGSSREGLKRKVYQSYLKSLGWEFHPTMTIGSGCHTHLRPEELPKGRIIVRLSRHLSAVVDGAIHDTFDPSRDGTRCVYGYFSRKAS